MTHGGVHGGAWTPLVYVLYLAGAVLAGRLWRMLPAWRRAQLDITEDL